MSRSSLTSVDQAAKACSWRVEEVDAHGQRRRLREKKKRKGGHDQPVSSAMPMSRRGSPGASGGSIHRNVASCPVWPQWKRGKKRSEEEARALSGPTSSSSVGNVDPSQPRTWPCAVKEGGKKKRRGRGAVGAFLSCAVDADAGGEQDLTFTEVELRLHESWNKRKKKEKIL